MKRLSLLTLLAAILVIGCQSQQPGDVLVRPVLNDVSTAAEAVAIFNANEYLGCNRWYVGGYSGDVFGCGTCSQISKADAIEIAKRLPGR